MKKSTLIFLFALIAFFYAEAAKVIVNPGSKTLRDAVLAAELGDTLMLLAGNYNEASTITIDKSLVVKADKNAETAPVINISRISVKADFSIYGIVIDGEESLSADAIRLEDGDNIDVEIYNCTLQNFSNRAIYFSAVDKTSPYVNKLSINGCVFRGIAQKVIYASNAPVQVKQVEIKNSTFTDLGNTSYFIHISAGEDLKEDTQITIDHCTFYNCYDRRGVYLYNTDGAIVQNCIAAYSEIKEDTKSFSVYGTKSVVRNNISYNVELYGNAPKQNNFSVNPMFVDPENGNFQLYANSPAVGAGNDGSNLGDPRWGVSTEEGATPADFVKKPYSMSPTTNSVRILWQMSDADSLGIVYYGKTEDLGQSIRSKEGRYIENEGFVHVVELVGLDPFTTYYYTVGNDVQTFDEIYKTKTAPEKGTDFRLVSLSDIHDNSGKIWQNMVHRIVEKEPDLMFFIGDMITWGDARPWNSSFFIPGNPALKQTAVLTVTGNHETNDKPSATEGNPTPTTYFDYFSLPSHGYIDSNNDFIDPRGESYYALDYGDVRLIGFDLNGNSLYSPSFESGSQQYQWLDNQLENADSKWIFMFAHVSIYSSSYHAQWSAKEKAAMTPLLEKHAAAGKKIIVFSGDEHNFEHLYKAGVHYVRPGASTTNIREQFNMADMPYSLLFNKTQGFSTIDVIENGEKVLLTARDSTGVEFYSYTFTRTGQMMPSVYITHPAADEEVVDLFRIRWSCFDPTGNSKINIYAEEALASEPILLAENLSSDLSEASFFDWNVRHLEEKGNYEIYAVIDDNINQPVTSYAKGKLLLKWDVTPPPAPNNFTGSFSDGKINLNWMNPVHLIPVENPIDDFENGLDHFYGVGDDGDGTLSIAEGYQSNQAMQINYNVTKAWGEYGAVVKFPEVQNFSTTPMLEFWYKGDGSNRKLRVIIKQDLDFNGVADDWWYNETISLSSTEWKKAELDITTFGPFSWHQNSSDAIEINNIFSIEFVVPSGTIGNGTLCLDEINLTGEIYPAPDYEGTKIIRRIDRFPQNHEDGEVVYNGSAETFTDENITEGEAYYYAGFTYDDLKNYSEFSSSASWYYMGVSGSEDVILPQSVFVYPNPAKLETSIYCTAAREQHVSVSINDLTGKKLQEESYILFTGENKLPLDCSALYEGLYFIRLYVDGSSILKKIIIN